MSSPLKPLDSSSGSGLTSSSSVSTPSSSVSSASSSSASTITYNGKTQTFSLDKELEDLCIGLGNDINIGDMLQMQFNMNSMSKIERKPSPDTYHSPEDDFYDEGLDIMVTHLWKKAAIAEYEAEKLEDDIKKTRAKEVNEAKKAYL